LRVEIFVTTVRLTYNYIAVAEPTPDFGILYRNKLCLQQLLSCLTFRENWPSIILRLRYNTFKVSTIPQTAFVF
jgi:hypothetical protein